MLQSTEGEKDIFKNGRKVKRLKECASFSSDQSHICHFLMPVILTNDVSIQEGFVQLLYMILLASRHSELPTSHLFPLPCGDGSTFPREGFDSSVIMSFPGCDTSYIVSVHIQCQASIYTLSLCRGHSWRVWLAKQETLTPPGHLVWPLVCRGPWMSTVVLYCWCRSDSASVLLYFTFPCFTDIMCGSRGTQK